MEIAPYGSWKSPITSDLIVSSVVALSAVSVDGEDIYWVEGRPLEGGRQVVVRLGPDGVTEDVTPPPFNPRTRVHEYGGGSYLVKDGVVWFSNFADQRLYQVVPGSDPQPLSRSEGMRYADADFDPQRGLLYCVREDHTRAGREPENTIVALDLESGYETVIAQGGDFYSTPRLSPDGTRLCWLTWDHPNMPWDGVELWIARLDERGRPLEPEKVAGGPKESIFQPEWSPHGRLFFVSDRTGWWNIYCLGDKGPELVLEREAEFGVPQWVFDARTYAFLPDGAILAAFTERGIWQLGTIDLDAHTLTTLDLPLSNFGSVRADARGRAYFLGSSPTTPAAVYRLDLQTRDLTPLRWSTELRVDARYFSEPEPIEFPTEGGLTAHALYYPPRIATGPALWANALPSLS